MKNEYFGNVLNENIFTGNNTEFYKANDKFSARTLNRPIRSSYEDLEDIYNVLQNICKTLYGQKNNGILPDVCEEMNEDNVIEGHFFNKPETFIRIPTGAFFAKLNDEQAKYYATSFEESNQYSRDFFIDNDRNAAIIFNRPNAELFERQLAEHFNIDLHDQDEDLKLTYECYTDDIEDSSILETEENQYDNIKSKFSRKQKIRYYITTNKTSYDFFNKQGQLSKIITSEVSTGRIPINVNNYCKNVFDLVENMNLVFGNYLTQEDNNFSLEEIIPIKTDQQGTVWQDGKYIIFFNPNTKTNNEEDLVRYSNSKRFGICSESTFKNIFGDNNYIVVKMFEVELSFDFDISNVRRCTVEKSKNLLSKIDRTTFDIKNINLTNCLNGLVIEKVNQLDNKNANINIGEAHIKENEKFARNISIGLKNLGYSKINNEDQDPTLLSQRYKENIGSDNISIGTEAMRNTTFSEEEGFAEGNIAIGTKALNNIGTGKKNIEIGAGNGFIKNSNSNINIGDNLTPKDRGLSFGDKNIIIGNENVYKTLKISNKNIIIGNENDGIEEGIVLKDQNIIFGNNKVQSLNSKNTVIGNNSLEIIAENNNTIIGIDNANGKLNSNNYILGSENCSGLLGDNNIIIGINNIKSKSANEETSDNYVLGKGNELNSKNSFIIGEANNTNELSANNYILGSENNLSYEKNIIVGTNNTISNKKNYVFGDSNLVSADNNKIIGDSNDVSKCNDNIIISNNFKIIRNNNVVVGCKDLESRGNITNNNQIIIGPLEGMKFCFDGLKDSEVHTTASCFKADSDGTLNIYFKEAEVYGNNFTLSSNIISKNGAIKSERYITQSILGKNMYVNNALGKEINKYEEDDLDVEDYNVGIPVSGSLYFSNFPDSPREKITEYKSFIGSVTTLNKNNSYDFISIRENNGAGEKVGEANKNGSILYINRSTGRARANTQKNGEWNKEDIEFLDNTGNQSILHPMKFQEGFIIPSTNNEPNAFIYNGLKVKGHVSFDDNDENDNEFKINIPVLMTKKVNIDSEEGFNFKTTNPSVINSNNSKVTFGEIVNNLKYSISATENIRTDKDVVANSFIATSARNKKKNIKPTKYKAIEEINKVKIVDFNFKSDVKNEKPKIGFIADDTDEIFSTKEKNSMDIYNCVGMLMKAVQELSAENKKLKKRIRKLEK